MKSPEILDGFQRPIASLIRFAVHFVDPEAEVILHGSQARGEANKWSDWDVVVIRKKAMDSEYWNAVVDAIYDVELATGEIITATVLDEHTWNEKGKGSLFYDNVMQDGIALNQVPV